MLLNRNIGQMLTSNVSGYLSFEFQGLHAKVAIRDLEGCLVFTGFWLIRRAARSDCKDVPHA